MDLAALPSAGIPRPISTSRPQRRPVREQRLDPIPRLSVVIVNYREWQSTAKLTRQLLDAPCTHRGLVEVVVVDNHSPAHPLIRRVRRWPRVSVRRWRRNHGFARAANEGCRLSRGDWVLLLNPDVTLPDYFLDSALTYAEEIAAQDPRTGVIGFQLQDSDGSRQLSSGPFPTLGSTLTGLLRPRSRRKYRPVHAEQSSRVPWVTGCCLLLRRECFQDLGGFDEEYFLYYEDVDFCRRADAKRWNVWYEPRLQAIHHHPLHTREVPAHLRLITRHALLTYAAKHWPRWQFRLLARIVQAEAVTREWAAWWRGHSVATGYFRHLRALAGELYRGCRMDARRRLQNVVRRIHEAANRSSLASVREQARVLQLFRGGAQP